MSPLLIIAILLILGGIFLVAGGALAALLWIQQTGLPLLQMQEPAAMQQHPELIMLINALTTTLAFGGAALATSFLTGPRPLERLGFNRLYSARQVFLVILIMVLALFVSGGLGELNKAIPVSETFRKSADALEKAYSAQVMAMLQLKSFGDFLLGLLVVALLPALVEELFFRAALQPPLIRLLRHPMAGIIATALLFSIIHASWYGFLARAVLGVVLGCLYYYSANLWLSILAHFLNNAIVVAVLYRLSSAGQLNEATLNANPVPANPYILGALSLTGLIFLLRSFRQESLLLYARHGGSTAQH